jgi:hypothetical protein
MKFNHDARSFSASKALQPRLKIKRWPSTCWRVGRNGVEAMALRPERRRPVRYNLQRISAKPFTTPQAGQIGSSCQIPASSHSRTLTSSANIGFARSIMTIFDGGHSTIIRTMSRMITFARLTPASCNELRSTVCGIIGASAVSKSKTLLCRWNAPGASSFGGEKPRASPVENRAGQPARHEGAGVDIDAVGQHLGGFGRSVAMHHDFAEVRPAGKKLLADP